MRQRSLLARRVVPAVVGLSLLLAPGGVRLDAADFVRGNSNGDPSVDISDAITTLGYLFLGGMVPDCLKAADADDSGAIEITDAIYLLNFLFQGGAAPPPPYPEAGSDPTDDALTCLGPEVSEIAATPSPVALARVGDTAQLQVTGTVGGAPADLTAGSTGTAYASSAAGIVFAYRDGLLEAKGPGSATVTIRNGAAETTVAVQVSAVGTSDAHEVLAVNNLGMHCIDREFSVYSILPLYNEVHVQVVRKDAGGPTLLDGNDVVVKYSPVLDAHGAINSKSLGKTDFWTHVEAAYGAALPPGQGLLGLWMPDDAPAAGPQPVEFSPTHGWFGADGIPITDRTDLGTTMAYPLVRFSAHEKATGRLLAYTDVVVPVSSETDCQDCHATGEMATRAAGVQWSADPDLEVQTKTNVLLLHDLQNGTDLVSRQPVLCAGCHYSPALDLGGTGPQGAQLEHEFFSRVMHGFHSGARDGEGEPAFPEGGDPSTACYSCHPGRTTQCLRGAMATGGLGCTDCHGGLAAVGGANPLAPGGSIDGSRDGQSRMPWIDVPRCQSCHTGDALSHLSGAEYVAVGDGIRLRQAYKVGDAAASAILATNKRFAENTNTLFRMSTGHGGVLCENCHGSTHAEWAHSDPAANDNVAATQLQGHSGKLIECGTCHAAGSLPVTANGPHGMHNVNDPRWTDHEHEEFFERNSSSCRACHGANLQGTVLSRTAAARAYRVEDRTVNVPKGRAIACNLCHGFPG